MIATKRILAMSSRAPFSSSSFSSSPRSLRLRSRASYSSIAPGERVPLAFDHHTPPPQSTRHRQDAPIIFMHGLFGSKKNNRSVSKVLARDLKRHVYTLDLRNHGESPHVPRHDYMAMADDVAGFISEHGLKEPTLIGHSMGAKTAMALALDQPSLISDIVAVDNAPVSTILSRNFAKYIQGMRQIEAADITRRSDADSMLSTYESDLAVRQFLLGNLHRTTSDETEGKEVIKFQIPIDILGKNLDNMGEFPFHNPDEHRFEKPALFVRGTRSKYIPDEIIPTIGRFFPRFSLADIDAGHWVISEKPAEFLRVVIEFLTPNE
ncbi:alpha beta hydrolase fold family [Xylaria nigripes]|nr:alpha beta hydrolase fold family [Xylaria nigripes]